MIVSFIRTLLSHRERAICITNPKNLRADFSTYRLHKNDAVPINNNKKFEDNQILLKRLVLAKFLQKFVQTVQYVMAAQHEQ